MSVPAPSSAPPRLTDRPALERNRTRAARMGREDWLHALVLDEIQDRLAGINRRFTAPAVVTGHPGFWSAAMPGARVVPDGAVLDLEPGAHDLVIHALADGIALGAFTTPTLTTVEHPRQELGRQAASSLIQLLADPSQAVTTKLLPGRLVVRESCGARPQAS